MWKEYSSGYLKNNRAAGASIVTVVFVCAVLLSLLCGFLFNLWRYEVERLKIEEGDWQSRIVGPLSEDDLTLIEKYPGVERVVIHRESSDGREIAADITFSDMRTVFAQTPRLAALAGLTEEAVSYYYDLLSLYLVRSPDDPALHWVFPFYLFVTAAACLSLVLIIHNAFAVTMDGRVRQLGILSGIGATPRQLRSYLLGEALALSALPAVAGNLLGILACIGVMRLIDLLAVIGIGNVFTNTFGFVWQRRREFARYLSIGMTPQGMKKLFCIEALVLAGRPILVAVPVTAAATAFFLNMAYLDPMVFLRKTPWLPMLLFVLAVFGFVALAYSIGGKRVMESSLIDALRDDTLI